MPSPISSTQIPQKEKKKDVKVSLQVLSARQVRAIDRAIVEVGEHGEVRLQVHRGRLRLIAKLKTRALNA